MNRWELIESARVPGTQNIMSLMRRGDELAIRVDGRELMSNRLHGSEDALAELAWKSLEKQSGKRTKTRFLIGGLGIGFTLAAAIRRLGPHDKAVVAELVPEVVKWNEGPLGEAAGHPLTDRRVSVYSGDVGSLIRRPPSPWDAILLDVDNGPSGLTRVSNDWLYSPEGLDASFAALKPGGVLAVWSAAPDNAFTRRFERAGFDVEPIPVRARGKKGGRRHIVWIGLRRAAPPRWRQG